MTNETMKDGERVAFEAWFATSGIWNDAIARRTWHAACDWARDVAAKVPQDEPRNVNGMTRSEFEHYLRVGYQHDNVRAQERGLGPKWPNGQIGLTPQDEREIAERVARNYPTLGTFACPICGKDAPHEHSAEDIVAHRNEQKARAASPQSGEKAEALCGVAYVILGALAAAGIDIPEKYLDAFSDPESVDDPLDLLPFEVGAAVPQEKNEVEQYVISILPSIYYMDPPDGGDVTVLEQLRRLADDAAKYRALTQAPTERMSDAARDVLAERARQLSEEGWTSAHDDQHVDGELASVAAVYALAGTGWHIDMAYQFWPAHWSASWFKQTTMRRDLIKAGALILAEIERIDRAARKAEIERGEGKS